MASAAEGLFGILSEKIGATEDSLRLIASLFLGYPLAFIYRQLLFGKRPEIQHIYFSLTGLALCYFNFGGDLIHSVINILAIYILLVICGGTTFSVAAAFLINTGYLCFGYDAIGSADQYDIKWTTPHCVLTLRLIAVVVDVYDGQKNPDSLTPDQKSTALKKNPSLLEMFGQVYFFGGFLVGPQFSMKRYQDFVNGVFADKVTKGPPVSSVGAGLSRLGLGLLVVFLYQIGAIFIRQSYLLSDDFQKLGFFSKCLFILFWGKLNIHKYVSAWLISEGSAIVTGLTYNGQDKNGNELWDGCTNVRLWTFETGSSFGDIIESFNRNTNLWMAKYVFKRLKFLGSKELSQAITLFYLALWHGLHSGYYMNFFLEFVMVNGEKQLQALIQRRPYLSSIVSNPTIQLMLWVVKSVTVHFSVSYALISFCLLRYDRWWHVYSSVYFIGHVVYFLWPFVHLLLQRLLPKSSHKQQLEQQPAVLTKKES
ncbi:lysophospholipid acyltransferase 5-like [Liolophura sinensis]|uniref:lysophospholipid acyltransferase 5-like n=1 Tax=Liolophura sinensis TaxID=3198878 RepID=UPI00315839B6